MLLIHFIKNKNWHFAKKKWHDFTKWHNHAKKSGIMPKKVA